MASMQIGQSQRAFILLVANVDKVLYDKKEKEKVFQFFLFQIIFLKTKNFCKMK
jgi:hypothetical protein